MSIDQLTRFSAVYCSGPFIPDPSAVTALALLFDKVHLPNNVEIIKAVARKYNFSPVDWGPGIRATVQLERSDRDSFSDLTPAQSASVERYLTAAIGFAHTFADLYGPVFESEMFEESPKLQVLEPRKPLEEGKGRFVTTFRQTLTFAEGDEDRLPRLLDQGYVPVVGKYHPVDGAVDAASTRQLAALLAMKSIEMVLPRTRPANGQVILEACHRLREHLPPFWSSMLKASTELRKILADSSTPVDLSREAADLVDRTIRPAVIDLATKLERERKDWFFRILSPLRSGLRLLVGSPPLTQQQLATTAMVLASDTCVTIAENMRAIDALKRDSGLTYLLELSDAFPGEAET